MIFVWSGFTVFENDEFRIILTKFLSPQEVVLLWKMVENFTEREKNANHRLDVLVSISSTWNVQIFRTNVVFSSCMYLEKAAETYVRTNFRTFNVDEIDLRTLLSNYNLLNWRQMLPRVSLWVNSNGYAW